jgi:hypothetical protein
LIFFSLYPKPFLQSLSAFRSHKALWYLFLVTVENAIRNWSILLDISCQLHVSVPVSFQWTCPFTSLVYHPPFHFVSPFGVLTLENDILTLDSLFSTALRLVSPSMRRISQRANTRSSRVRTISWLGLEKMVLVRSRSPVCLLDLTESSFNSISRSASCRRHNMSYIEDLLYQSSLRQTHLRVRECAWRVWQSVLPMDTGICGLYVWKTEYMHEWEGN